MFEKLRERFPEQIAGTFALGISEARDLHTLTQLVIDSEGFEKSAQLLKAAKARAKDISGSGFDESCRKLNDEVEKLKAEKLSTE